MLSSFVKLVTCDILWKLAVAFVTLLSSVCNVTHELSMSCIFCRLYQSIVDALLLGVLDADAERICERWPKPLPASTKHYSRGLKLISACGPHWKVTASQWAAPRKEIVFSLNFTNTTLTAVKC